MYSVQYTLYIVHFAFLAIRAVIMRVFELRRELQKPTRQPDRISGF